MGATRPDELHGLEFDWLACDADGWVALLSTAGSGVVPASVLQDVDAQDSAIDAILGLPTLHYRPLGTRASGWAHQHVVARH
jgi:hypothetical protein